MVVFSSMSEMGEANTVAAGAVPLPKWPDGRWCHEVALFLGKATRGNLSRFSKGGTLRTYVNNLSHLVRFCWRKNCPFDELNDSIFTAFIQGLTKEKEKDGLESKDVRNANTVCNIGRRSLDFLSFVGELHGIDGFLDGSGGHIKAEKRAIAVGSHNSRSRKLVYYWHHHSFPEPVPVEKRHLIGIDYVSRLRRAAVTCGSEPFVMQRRLVMLRVLEATGGRRSEIALITVGDIEEALATEGPFLKLYSAKKMGMDKSKNPHRFVKVTFNDLEYIRRYIEVFRAPLIERTLSGSKDHGYLLISETSGTPIRDTTITGEVRTLRIAAKITGKAHPHLFRHRFVTIRLKDLILSHKLANRSEFELKFKMAGFMKEVAEQTGHKSLGTLDHYIDWAFIELSGEDGAASNHVDLARVAASVESSVAELKALREQLSADDFTLEVMRRYEALARDVGAIEKRHRRGPGGQKLHDVTQ